LARRRSALLERTADRGRAHGACMRRGTRRAVVRLPRQAAPALAERVPLTRRRGSVAGRGAMRAGLAHAWSYRYCQSAQPAADRSVRQLVKRRRRTAPAAGWAARRLLPAPVVGAHEPERQRLLCPHHPPSRGLCWGALRVRWVALLALQPGTACAGCGGRPFGESAPPPTRRRRRPRLQPQTPRGFRALRAAPALPLPPGAPTENPSPARRNTSLAHRRAHAVKATPCGWLEDSPALTAPTGALSFTPPPGRKNGLGEKPKEETGKTTLQPP